MTTGEDVKALARRLRENAASPAFERFLAVRDTLTQAADALERLSSMTPQDGAVVAERERVLSLLEAHAAKYLASVDQWRFREVIDWVKTDARKRHALPTGAAKGGSMSDSGQQIRGITELAHDIMIDRRAIDSEDRCKACHGWGMRTYGSTATWRGGVGGQAMTTDVCDRCWGSGSASKPWPSWRDRDRYEFAAEQRDAVVKWLLREKDRHEARTRGGQHVNGPYGPRVSASVLKELLALVGIA
jgi:hypothetical protein